MAKKPDPIDNLTSDKDDLIFIEKDKTHSGEFQTRENALDKDIDHIDNRSSNIQTYIAGIDIQINNIKSLIKGSTNPNEKGKLYNILNQCLDLNVKYLDLYLRSLDLKHKYRREQNELTLRKIRYIEIELKKLETDQDDRGLTPSKLVQIMKEVENSITNKSTGTEKSPSETKTPVIDVFSILDEDPDLSLT